MTLKKRNETSKVLLMCLDSAASQGIHSLPFCVCMPRVQAALKVSASSVVTLGMRWVSPAPLVVTCVPFGAAKSPKRDTAVSNSHHQVGPGYPLPSSAAENWVHICSVISPCLQKGFPRVCKCRRKGMWGSKCYRERKQKSWILVGTERIR